MTKEEKDKLLEALFTVKEFCNLFWNEGSCDKCPMRDIHGCYVTNTVPKTWTIKISADDDWRAFYD